jgi:hypothetical protein
MKSTELPALPPEIEALLDDERALTALPDDVRARAMARARASLRARAAPLAVSHGSRMRPVRLFAAAGISLAIVTVCAAALHARRRPPSSRGTPPRPEVAATWVAAAPSATPGAAPAAPAASAASAVSAVLPPIERVDRVERLARSERRSRATRASPRSLPPETDGTMLELGLLRQARDAVARGDLAAALAPVAEHARRFPEGRLAEEREALRVRALTGLGRSDEARGAAAGFRARFPHSVLLPRVDEMLQAPP